VPPQANYSGVFKENMDEHSMGKSSGISRSQQIANMSSSLTSLSTSSLLFNYHQYKKCHSASIPIYLSEAGFLKMLTANPETNCSPLEVFLASYHLKKLLIKAIQNDLNTVKVWFRDDEPFCSPKINFKNSVFSYFIVSIEKFRSKYLQDLFARISNIK
jgi:hypothetical protein